LVRRRRAALARVRGAPGLPTAFAVRLGRLLVALGPIVRDIEPRALEEQTSAGREQPLRLRAALRAGGDRRLAHGLELLELVTLFATVLVRRHRSLRSVGEVESLYHAKRLRRHSPVRAPLLPEHVADLAQGGERLDR